MDKFLELTNSYELYEFVRQYYLDLDDEQLKNLKYPISVSFDNITGKPIFTSSNKKPKNFKIQFDNCGDSFFCESDDINEILEFIKDKSVRRPQIGDVVSIVDPSLLEKKDVGFFRRNFVDYKFACLYDYGSAPSEEDTFTVVYVREDKVLIQSISNEKCYIVNEKGIKSVQALF